MKSILKGLLAASVAIALASSSALAGGFLTNGYPQAGGTQYPFTIPLTGNELVPADTQLTNGQAPQSEAISVSQLKAFVGSQVTYTANAATSSTTATAASMAGTGQMILDMTGTLSAAGTLTTPTATALEAAAPGTPIGGSYMLRVINRTSATNAWTLTGGTGVTVNGTASIAAASWRDFVVTFTSATAVTIQSVGGGSN